MNPAHNRFAPRRLFVVALIGLIVSLALGMLEAGLRELFGYPYLGPITGASAGFVMWVLVFQWRGGYPKAP